jgi:hypothetical protein
MPSTVFCMSMAVDGFIAGPNEGPVGADHLELERTAAIAAPDGTTHLRYRVGKGSR